jgi:hypothetical protein
MYGRKKNPFFFKYHNSENSMIFDIFTQNLDNGTRRIGQQTRRCLGKFGAYICTIQRFYTGEVQRQYDFLGVFDIWEDVF